MTLDAKHTTKMLACAKRGWEYLRSYGALKNSGYTAQEESYYSC